MYTTILFDKLLEHFGIIFMSVLYRSNVGHRSDPCGTAVGAFPSSPYLPRTLKPAESRHSNSDLKKVKNSLLLTHSCQSCVRDGECFKLSGDTKPVWECSSSSVRSELHLWWPSPPSSHYLGARWAVRAILPPRLLSHFYHRVDIDWQNRALPVIIPLVDSSEYICLSPIDLE